MALPDNLSGKQNGEANSEEFSFPHVIVRDGYKSSVVTDNTNGLDTPLFRVGDTGISSKNLLHWKRNGLLLEKRKADTGWNKFDFVEYIWLQIISELRGYGLPIEIIKKIKDELIFPTDFHKRANEFYTIEKFRREQGFENYPISFLQFAIDDYKFSYVIQTFRSIVYQCVKARCNMFLIVFKDGVSFFAEEGSSVMFKRFYGDGNKLQTLTKIEKLDSDLEDLSPEMPNRLYESNTVLNFTDARLKSYVTISITGLIKDYLMLNNNKLKINDLEILSENEKQVLQHLKDDDLVSLTVRLKNKKITLIELNQTRNNVEVESRFLDHILKNGYQEVNFQTKNGQIVDFQKVTKIKL